jgi:hypothetical protein
MIVDLWVQSCPARRQTRERTLASLRESDVVDSFEVLEAPMVPHRRLGEFVWRSLRERAEAALAAARRQERILLIRLEDDVVVNRHLVHNVLTWPAVGESDFVCGTLFTMDGRWPGDMWWGAKPSGAFFRRDERVGCGQGWVFNARRVAELLPRIAAAERKLGRGPLFDDHLSAALFGWRPYYVHVPSLVNCHDGCLLSACGKRWPAGHFAHDTFRLNWRRDESRSSQEVRVAERLRSAQVALLKTDLLGPSNEQPRRPTREQRRSEKVR